MLCLLGTLFLSCFSASSLQTDVFPSSKNKRQTSIFATHNCLQCSATFDSRNSLFRHVRSEHVAWGDTQAAVGLIPRRKVAVCMGYMTNATDAMERITNAFISAVPDVETVNLTHATSKDSAQDFGATSHTVVFSYKSRYQITPNFIETLNEGLPEFIRAFHATELSLKSRIDAEKSCTQFIYHYLMPLLWLPSGQETASWWLQTAQRASNSTGHQSRQNTKPPLLKQLKQVLTSLEMLSSKKEHPIKPATSGRFGTLANNPRLSLHNYDPSDNTDWKSIDRLQVVDFVSYGDQVAVIVELRGDSPLPVRRIIGAIVAILNGWLPETFFESSTQPGIHIDVPLAPSLHYITGCRYDFDEVRWGHKLFNDTDSMRRWKQQIQDNYLSKLRNTEDWLQDLQLHTCPAIQQQLDSLSVDVANGDSMPPEYRPVVSHIRRIVQTGRWPATSATRSRILRARSAVDPTTGFPLGTFTVVNTDVSAEGLQLVNGNYLFPELVKAVFELEKVLIGTTELAHRSPSSHCAINFNAEFTPHLDSGSQGKADLSLIVGTGNYKGGSFVLDGMAHDIQHRPLEFDGWKQWHWTDKFQGDRITLVYFTPAFRDKYSHRDSEASTAHARHLIQTFGNPRGMPSIHFRSDSTDTLVIQEILGEPCVYNNCPPIDQADFSPKNHVVLDIGAHIGVFSLYALGEGCKRIVSFEPEKENYNVLVKNMQYFGKRSSVNCMAVAHGDSGQRHFVLGSNNQRYGDTNTWRHSLAEYSTYQDEDNYIVVDSVPFFGPAGVLTDDVTFVKLDCEGAEMDILLSNDASSSRRWKNVTRVVFEWSFTKNRSTTVFHKAIHNLRLAKFEVRYEGQGAWWDTADCTWPYHNDILVFAFRDICRA